MQFRIASVFFIMLLSLSSCATSTMKKWVEGDMFYSERMPAVRVRVKQGFTLDEVKSDEKSATDYSTGAETAMAEAQKIVRAIFKDKQKGSRLTIKTSLFPPNAKWSYYSPDYSGYSNILKHYDVKFLGGRYAVGIYPYENKKGTVYLVKKFGRIFGEKSKLELYYSERVGAEWSKIRILNTRQDEFLKEFSKRADDSFEILPYAAPAAQPATVQSTREKATDLDSAIATATNEDTKAILEYIKNAGKVLDVDTRANLIKSALNSAENTNTREILKAMK